MRSMTGFGRGEATANGWSVEAELAGVNRKQLDIGVTLPAGLTELEPEVRRVLTEGTSRGRIGLKVSLSHTEGSDSRLVFDRELAKQYIVAAKTIADDSGIETRLTAADLFRAPGIFKIDEDGADPEEIREALMSAVQNAFDQLVKMQKEEGENLRADLLSRIDHIVSEVDAIREVAPTVPKLHRENLHKRLAESGVDIDLDDERILREFAVFSERSDISEELTRIDSHVGQFQSYIQNEEPVGRSLDFLCQEFNRELNTIGSKANDAAIAQRIVNAKTELEKIREQVQNVQ